MAEVMAEPKVSDPKVTTKKEKDPKRVEMGKKLAELSKAARERKKLEALRTDREAEASRAAEDSKINYGYLIGAAGLLVAIGSLYYSRMAYNRGDCESEADREDREEPGPKPSPTAPSTPTPPKPGRFIKLQ